MNTELSQTMSPEIGKLALALSKAQGEMKNATKDAENPFFKSKYADLATVWDVIRIPLSKNELSISQTTDGEPGSVTVVTILLHSSGQWIRGFLRMTPTKNDPQGIGSAVTYARRYALSAIVGVATEDDDAESAIDRGPKAQNKAPANFNNSKPYWTSSFEGKQYIFAKVGGVYDTQFLSDLKMKPTAKNKDDYCSVYSEEIEKSLKDKLSLKAVAA